MRKNLKKGMLVISGALCLGFAVAGAACAGGNTSELPQKESPSAGVVHFLERGEPSASLGETGDGCLVATTGEFFRKTENGWKFEELESYQIDGAKLTASFHGGSSGTYELVFESEGEHVHTFDGDFYTVFDAKCVIPGIAVKYCSTCKEAFPEILPVVPENHEINAKNYGKCNFCGKLEDGTPGFEVNDGNQLSDVFEQVEDGDTVKLAEDATLGIDDRLVVGGEGENMDITLDVAGKTFTSEMNEQTIESENTQTNIVVEEGSKLTITDTSEEKNGTFDVNFKKYPWNGGNYSSTGEGQYGLKVDGGELVVTDITFNIENKTGGFATVVSNGGSVKFDKSVTINMTGKTNELSSEDDNDNGYGMFVTNGAKVEMNGANLVAEGDIAPFMVGLGAEDSTVDLSNGSTFTMKNCYNDVNGSSFAAGFVIYPGGTVNVGENCKMQLIGESINPNYIEGGRQYSTAIGFVCIGGGNVNFRGSMYLGMSAGTAVGFRTMTNRSIDTSKVLDSSKSYYGGFLVVDANIFIGDGASINAATETGGGFHIFEVQKSGVQNCAFTPRGNVWVTAEYYDCENLKASVTIQPMASIQIDGVECYDWTSSQMATNEQKAEEDKFQLDLYDRNGIQDNRTQPTD